MLLTHHHSLLIALLVATFTLACGPSERRIAPSGYEGPTQIEGQDPDDFANGVPDIPTIFAEVYTRNLTDGDDQERLYCQCHFQDEGYSDAATCLNEQYGFDYDATLASITSCLRPVIAAQPLPPTSILQAFSEAHASFQDYDRCYEAIDTSACSGDAFSDAFSAYDDCYSAHFDDLMDFEPTTEDLQWFFTMEDEAENAGCFGE